MHDQWDKPKSPASVAASNRLGSSMPMAATAPMRRGQMVWNQDDKVFMRESDLKACEYFTGVLCVRQNLSFFQHKGQHRFTKTKPNAFFTL